MSVYVLFYHGQLSHLPSCFGAGVTNLNEPPSSFLLPPHYCGLGAGSIPLRSPTDPKQGIKSLQRVSSLNPSFHVE